MLDEKDLQAIAQLIDGKLDPVQKEIRKINLTLENDISPNLQLLAEGQKTILDTLAPKSRVEALEDEMAFMKSVIKAMSAEIQELKKAQ